MNNNIYFRRTTEQDTGIKHSFPFIKVTTYIKGLVVADLKTVDCRQWPDEMVIKSKARTHIGYLLFCCEYQIYFIESGEKISILHECAARVKIRIFYRTR